MPSLQTTLEIKGLDKLIEDFERAGVNYRPVMTQAMQRSTQKVKNAIQNNITSKGITFQGSLRRSVQINTATFDRGVVGVGERYGAVVEFGRRPGSMPPVEPIERWASIKLGAPGAGFVIARKIKQQGTKAQPYVEPAFVDNVDYILDQFAKGADTLLAEMAGK